MNWNTIQPIVMQASMAYSSIERTYPHGSVSGLCYAPQKVCHLIDAVSKEYADLVVVPTGTVVGQRSVEKSQVGRYFPAKMIPREKSVSTWVIFSPLFHRKLMQIRKESDEKMDKPWSIRYSPGPNKKLHNLYQKRIQRKPSQKMAAVHKHNIL